MFSICFPICRSDRNTSSIVGGCVAFPSQLRPLPQQVFRVFDGDSKVGAAKISEHREIYADHFSVAVEERSARTARGGGGVVDNFVVKHVAYMALRRGGADEVLRSELRHDAIDVLGVADDFLSHIATGPGENAFNSCRITN